MSFSTLVTDAIERLKTLYNGAAYNAVSNVGGLGQGGHRTNFVPAIEDVGTVAEAVGTVGEQVAEDAATASAAASTASAAAAAAATSYDNFDDRYLGSKSSAPTLDNDGNALQEGAIYWDSVAKAMKSWNGSSWATFSATGPAGSSADISDAPGNTLAMYSQLGAWGY